jgi:hypothetical protein
MRPIPEVYKKVRAIIDPLNDAKISQNIDNKQSILLETTHIDQKWAAELEKTHKTIAIVCNTSFAQIESNIESRNRVNIRKTGIDQARYDLFQEEIKTYGSFINSVANYDMSSGKITTVKSGGSASKESESLIEKR